MTSIEFSFDPCNIYRDGPRGVGYPADARSVDDNHPSVLFTHFDRWNNRNIPTRKKIISYANDGGMAPRPHPGSALASVSSENVAMDINQTAEQSV